MPQSLWLIFEDHRAMKNGVNKFAGVGASSRKKFRSQTNVTRKQMRTRDHIFTLGIEEEFQIVDPKTRELRSHIQQILADGKMFLKEHVKAEMHQSVVELGTEICTDTAAARQSLLYFMARCAP
jgi:Glutamate-cysteine ligase family 2(GCS2)